MNDKEELKNYGNENETDSRIISDSAADYDPASGFLPNRTAIERMNGRDGSGYPDPEIIRSVEDILKK